LNDNEKILKNRCFRGGCRLHCELASAGRVLVSRRPDDQVDDDQTIVHNACGLPPDCHDIGYLKPDYLRLDELQHPQRAVSNVLHENPETATGKPVHGYGHDDHQEQDSAFDYVQHFELHARKSGDVFEGSNRALGKGRG